MDIKEKYPHTNEIIIFFENQVICANFRGQMFLPDTYISGLTSVTFPSSTAQHIWQSLEYTVHIHVHAQRSLVKLAQCPLQCPLSAQMKKAPLTSQTSIRDARTRKKGHADVVDLSILHEGQWCILDLTVSIIDAAIHCSDVVGCYFLKFGRKGN